MSEEFGSIYAEVEASDAARADGGPELVEDTPEIEEGWDLAGDEEEDVEDAPDPEALVAEGGSEDDEVVETAESDEPAEPANRGERRVQKLANERNEYREQAEALKAHTEALQAQLQVMQQQMSQSQEQSGKMLQQFLDGQNAAQAARERAEEQRKFEEMSPDEQLQYQATKAAEAKMREQLVATRQELESQLEKQRNELAEAQRAQQKQAYLAKLNQDVDSFTSGQMIGELGAHMSETEQSLVSEGLAEIQMGMMLGSGESHEVIAPHLKKVVDTLVKAKVSAMTKARATKRANQPKTAGNIPSNAGDPNAVQDTVREDGESIADYFARLA